MFRASRASRLALSLPAVAAALVLGLPCVARAADEVRELKLSVAVGPAYAMGRAAEQWAKLVTDGSNGRLRVRVSPGSALAHRDAAQEPSALRSGAADLAVGSSLTWSAEIPELAVASLPWLAPSSHALAALAHGEVAERLFAALDRAGVVPVAVAPLGHRVLATVRDPVVAPADLEGRAIRVPANALLHDTYAALGAKPRAVSGTAARNALRTGDLDGQDGTSLIVATARLDAQGIRHVTLWSAFGELALFAVARARWDAASDDERALLRDAARTAAHDVTDAARLEREGALEALRTRGVAITRLHAHAPFVAAVQPVLDKWSAAVGPELVAAARAASQAATP